MLFLDSPSGGFQAPCETPITRTEHISLLTEAGYDLVCEGDSGKSSMHEIICQDELAGFVLDNGYELFRTSPFPWHLEWWCFGNIAFLRSRFREFQQKLPRDAFRRILNLEPERGWSPLCRAASLDLVHIMDNCLSMGAEIDFEGCPVGSALMVATICGSINAVKFLVSRQASLHYIGKRGPIGVISLTEPNFIREWLLVKRFTEKLTIEPGSGQPPSNLVAQNNLWSGLAQARLKVVGKWARRWHESSLDHAKKLNALRNEWNGKVVPIDDGLVYPP